MTRDHPKLSVIERILDLARWAPSGDNTQPWRFEILGDDHVAVHCFDTRDHIVYDLQGHASQIAMGALIETIAIAATAHGLGITAKRRSDTPEERPAFDVRFIQDQGIATDPLIAYIETRTVQRRPMSTRALSSDQRKMLEGCLPTGYRAIILEGFSNRLAMAKLMFLNDKLRLTMPEAFQVHRSIIDWKKRYSDDKIPEQAVGVDYLTARLMQWTLQSWDRVAFMNKYLAGTLAPRIQLAFLPALACGAHFAIIADNAPSSLDDYVAAGRAVQRFWLTTTMLGLQFQPEMTPLIFHEYRRNGVPFSKTDDLIPLASQISSRFTGILRPENANSAVFLGRIGHGRKPESRSLRLDLARLKKV